MKKLIAGISFLLLLTSCQKNLKIKTKLSQAPTQEVTLEHFYMDSFITLDIAEMVDGKFDMSIAPTYPSLLRLRFGLGKYIFLSIAEGDTKVGLKGDWSDIDGIEFTGSESTQDLNQFMKSMRTFATQQNTYLMVLDALESDPTKDSLYKDAQSKIQSSRVDFELGVENYINESPYLLNKLFVLNLLNQKVKHSFIDSTLMALKVQYPDNAELEYSIETISPYLLDESDAPLATEINGKDPQGNEVKLSDYRGQYVLVDFWASWCAPCIIEMPDLVDVYNDFKNQNFTILGVSLDQNKDKWKRAIKKHHLDWHHSSELLGWQAISVRDYNVESIPYSVLIDPDGRIIATDLDTDELRKKLKELFPS